MGIDFPSLCALGVLFMFVALETLFRVQLLWVEALVWLLNRRDTKRELTERMTTEEELLSDYLIG